ncbi:Tat pathway signal sequence domain protein [Catenulispora sp. NF23]|uniref:LamG-like jellyroll fold domain-containing protein n=1 Tax=Catenulispora pinistramenti TaxID=2705254 RepID=UPI001BA498C5|nr:LamG-like jellyroll fold domain-containing protein [Catenulispora pinistramenti]MBS2537348.1 Tat pathway signal sequence domain protein [Catenulispora pinistramenti]
MNHEHDDAHCECPRTAEFDSAGPAATGRRDFLRNAGLLGVGATALASGATVFGPAAAAAADTASTASAPSTDALNADHSGAGVYDITAIDTRDPGARWDPDPENPVFTLVVMPDTQYMFDQDRIHPAPMEASFRYILSGDEEENIVFMAHLGDLTQNGQAGEFAAAGSVFEMLDRKRVAYSVVAGNHDVSGTDQRGATPYSGTFTKARAAKSPSFGGASPDGYNTFHVFRGGGREWLLLGLDWRLSPAGFAWANKVITDHPTLPVIITTHEIVYADDSGTAYLSDYGQQLWDGLIKNHDQVFLTLNGHYWPPGSATLTNTAGHDVHVHITNYQDRYYGGAAMIRTYRFDMRRGTIDVSTFSPWIRDMSVGQVNELAGQEMELTSSVDRFSMAVDFPQRFSGFAPVAPRPARPANKMLVRGTLAYWRFDGGGADGSAVADSQVIRDLSGRGNDLVKENVAGTKGSPLTWSTSEFHPDQPGHGSLRFVGQGHPVQGAWLQTVPNAPLNNETFQHGYTFEAFFKLPADWDSSQSAWSGLLSRWGLASEAGKSGGNTDPQEPIGTLSLSGGSELQWNVYPLNQSGASTTWSHLLPLGQWWHVAVVNDGKVNRMYVNGCEEGRNPSTPAIGITTLKHSWLLGGYEYGGVINQIHNGWLGDVRITGRPLRIDEFMNA